MMFCSFEYFQFKITEMSGSPHFMSSLLTGNLFFTSWWPSVFFFFFFAAQHKFVTFSAETPVVVVVVVTSDVCINNVAQKVQPSVLKNVHTQWVVGCSPSYMLQPTPRRPPKIPSTPPWPWFTRISAVVKCAAACHTKTFTPACIYHQWNSYSEQRLDANIK